MLRRGFLRAAAVVAVLLMLSGVFCLSAVASEGAPEQTTVISSYVAEPSGKEETTAADTSSSDTVALVDSDEFNKVKGSFYDNVFTFWYWIFGDNLADSAKLCSLLTVITIVWMIYLIIPKGRRNNG